MTKPNKLILNMRMKDFLTTEGAQEAAEAFHEAAPNVSAATWRTWMEAHAGEACNGPCKNQWSPILPFRWVQLY